MEQNKKPIQPFYMPQVSAPFTFVKDNLAQLGIEYRPVVVSVGQLKPIQTQVDLEKVTKLSRMKDLKTAKPVYIAENEKILDGHHRVAAVKFIEGDKAKIHAIRLLCDDRDGLSALKVVQDRWEQKYDKGEK